MSDEDPTREPTPIVSEPVTETALTQELLDNLESTLTEAFSQTPYTLDEREKRIVAIRVIQHLDTSPPTDAVPQDLHDQIHDLVHETIGEIATDASTGAALPPDVYSFLDQYAATEQVEAVVTETALTDTAITRSIRQFSSLPYEILDVEVTSEHIAYRLLPQLAETPDEVSITQWRWYDLRWSTNPNDDSLDHELELQIQPLRPRDSDTIYVAIRDGEITSIRTRPFADSEQRTKDESLLEAAIPTDLRATIAPLVQDVLQSHY